MKLVMAFFALVLAGLAATPALADDPLSIEANLKYLEDNKKQKGWIIRPSGLQFRILQNGYGKRPSPTDTVKVYYTGKLINGVVFDGTARLDEAQPGDSRLDRSLAVDARRRPLGDRDPAQSGLWRARLTGRR